MRIKRIYQQGALFSILWLGLLNAQVIITNPPDKAIKSNNHIAVTVTGRPGTETTLFVNDEKRKTGKIRIDGFLDFLNIVVPPGPNSIVVEVVGAGNRIYRAERTIHVLGPPKNIIPYEPDVSLPANGISRKRLQFEVQDQWGYTIPNVKFATVSLTNGVIVNEDENGDVAGLQAAISDGVFFVSLQSPLVAGKGILEIEINGEYLQFPISYTTPIKPFILVGSVRGTAIGKMSTTGSDVSPYVESIDATDAAFNQDGLALDGRTAFYATGTVGDGYRLTASLDTDRDYYDQIYQDVDPDEPLPIYGDASVLTYDAQSKSRFFARVDHNTSFVLFGDYNTSFNSTEFAASNRTMNGLFSQFNVGNHYVSGFASYADQVLGRDQIRGDGTSGFYYLSHANIIWRSEKIKIEVRDKYHPEVILKSQDMHRYQDYDINYVDGTIMFKQPVPSVDEEGNPRYILVFYEYKTNTNSALVTGLRYEGQINNRLRLGSTFLREEQGKNDYMLTGFDLALPVNDWLAVKGEVAQSRDPNLSGGMNQGLAYKTEINLTPAARFNVTGYFRNVDSLFTNRSQLNGNNESGNMKYGIKGEYGTNLFGRITSEYYFQGNKMGTVNESRVNVFNVYMQKEMGDRYNFKLGYEENQVEKGYSSSQTGQTATLLRGSAIMKISDKLSGLIDHDQNLGGSQTSKPTNTALGLGYDITKKLRTYIKYRHLYDRTDASQTVLGFDSKVSDNTAVTGKYEMGGAIGDDRNRASIGLRNQWSVREDLIINLAYENVSTIDSLQVPTPEHSAGSVSLEYFPDMPIKITAKQELKTDKVSKKSVTTLGSDFKVYNSLSGILKINNQYTRYKQSGQGFTRHQEYSAGLALRPEKSDRINGFARLSLVGDRNTHVTPTINLERMITSVMLYWQPVKKWEFGGRYAHRRILDEEGNLFSDKTATDFYSLRGEYELNLSWGLAADFRMIHLKPVNEYKFGTAVEINYVIYKNTQLGMGYMFTRYNDPDFAFLSSDISGFYLTVNLKLSEKLFE